MKSVGTKEGLVWIVVGIVICLLSLRIDLGSFREPGAGFVPFASGLALVVIGVVMRLSSSAGARDDRSFLRMPKLPLVYTMVLLIGYGVVLDGLGFIVTTFLMMFGLFYDRGANRPLPSALASLATVAFTYLLFETWLHCQLPRGIFPW